MSDRVRAALRGGGSIEVSVRTMHREGLQIRVREVLYNAESKETTMLTTAELDAAADPDALIRDTAVALVHKAHIRYEARKEDET